METKKAARRISLANDINSLSLNELGDKYLRSKTTFDKFMKDYSDLFCCDALYQLRAYDNYNKIKELIDYGCMMYPSEKNNSNASDILSEMSLILDGYNYNKLKDSVNHADFSFSILTGAYKAKQEESYSEMIKWMDKAAKKYEAKNGRSLEDFPMLANMLKYSVSPEHFDYNLGVYMDSHPLMKECNDIHFLYFANYIISKSNDIDPEFIKDVKDVIEVSKTFNRQIIHPIAKNKDYGRVARFTLKNIDRYEKSKMDKEEEISKKLIKKSHN